MCRGCKLEAANIRGHRSLKGTVGVLKLSRILGRESGQISTRRVGLLYPGGECAEAMKGPDNAKDPGVVILLTAGTAARFHNG